MTAIHTNVSTNYHWAIIMMASTHDVNKMIITTQTDAYMLEEGKKNHRSVRILSCFLNRTWKCCFRSNTCSILETKWWIECVHYDNTHVDTGETKQYTLHWTCKRLYYMWQKHSFHMEPITQLRSNFESAYLLCHVNAIDENTMRIQFDSLWMRIKSVLQWASCERALTMHCSTRKST